MTNITENIRSKIGKNLHQIPNHPICIIKNKIYEYFGSEFTKFENMPCEVSTDNNFDKLLIPKDHPARGKSDTYYVNSNTVLRTHTSAHQHELLSANNTKFLVTGDVYRRDEIDRSHYPVFHQMEGVCITENDQDPEEELIKTLVGLVQHLFPNCKYVVSPDYFPFTHPSFEIEVVWEDRKLEILGCGVIQPKILEDSGHLNKKGWAFGLGLERLAMILFKIPDIRYFWSDDPKFLSQFSENKITEFIPYSTLEPITKDISFYVPDDRLNDNNWLDQNDFFELYRSECNDLVEKIVLIDSFRNKKTNQQSFCYRATFKPRDTLIKDPADFNKLVNSIQEQIRGNIDKLNVLLR